MRERLAFTSIGVLLVVCMAEGACAQINAETTLYGQSLFGNLYTNDYPPLPFGQARPDWLCLGDRTGYNGFQQLYAWQWPNQNLTCENALNMEFYIDGVPLNPDYTISDDGQNTQFFAPRYDYCLFSGLSLNRAAINWPSRWQYAGMDMTMAYQMTDNGIDLTFTAVPRHLIPNAGWIGIMWASYMNCAISRYIHFYGCKLDPTGDLGDNTHLPVVVSTGWQEMGAGDQNSAGDEIGIVPQMGVPYLDYDQNTLGFVAENRTYRFLYPFYYGLIDGDGDLSTASDTMAWIVMFDQEEPIRLLMYNFRTDPSDPTKANVHQPAWDWQYVIQNPQIGEQYAYRARIIYKPFVSEDDVMQEYLSWKNELAGPIAIKLYSGDSYTLTPRGSLSGLLGASYQWKYSAGGAAIDGPLTPDWALAGVTAANEGLYWCEITAADGSRYQSNTASLTVRDHLTIVQPLCDLTVEMLAPCALGVQVAGGYDPLLLVWKKDGAVISECHGISYALSEVRREDAGTYTLEIADGNTDYRATTATLTAIPCADDLPATYSTSSTMAYVGDPFHFDVSAATSAPPLAYAWEKDGEVLPGATCNTFTIASLQLSDSGAYTVEVTDAATGYWSTAVAVTVRNHIEITGVSASTSDGIAHVGDYFYATIEADGGYPPLTYVWKKDGVPVLGAPSNTLVIPSLRLSDSGIYDVDVSDSNKDVAEFSARLTVLEGVPVVSSVSLVSLVSLIAIAGLRMAQKRS